LEVGYRVAFIEKRQHFKLKQMLSPNLKSPMKLLRIVQGTIIRSIEFWRRNISGSFAKLGRGAGALFGPGRAADHRFSRDMSTYTWLSAVLIQKVVAMLAEIFMVWLEAKARSVEEEVVLPSCTCLFIPFNQSTQFTFKTTGPKGPEVPSTTSCA
jgi:hypothetical protein